MIQIISRHYHFTITKISIKYQNVSYQTNDILSGSMDPEHFLYQLQNFGNKLPSDIRSCHNSSLFKPIHQTYLYKKCYFSL